MEGDTVPMGFWGTIASYVGLTEPVLRLLLTLLAGYPLALIHRHYIFGKDKNLQHLYFILTGLLLGFFNFGFEIAHNIFAVIFTYIVLVFCAGTSISVGITFVFNLGYLLIGYYCTSTEDYDICWTMPHCILTLRLIGTAFDLYDGKRPKDKLSEDMKKTVLYEQPSFLELMGHCYFPAGFIIGPQFPMRRYLSFVAGEFGNKCSKGVEPPECVKAALQRLYLGILYGALYIILQYYVDNDYMLSEEFGNERFLKRMWLLGLWGRYTLYKYIACWLLAEGACILFGLTYDGEDEQGKNKWSGCQNVNLLVFENATQFNHYIQSFNINTNTWVARYIYKRLKFFNNKFISQAVSLIFLAFWHGFHTGYFVCFFMEFIVMFMEKDLQPIIKSNERVYNILTKPPINILVYVVLRAYTFVFMGWCLLPFVFLSPCRYWVAFRNVNFVGFLLFGLYPFVYRAIILKLLKKPKSKDRVQNEREKREKDGEKGTSSTSGGKEHHE